MAGRFRAGPAATPDTLVSIDETNASAAIKITGRAFVTASNDLDNNIQTTRWNRSRFVRISGTNVELQVGPAKLRASARTATGAERSALWKQMAELFPPYDAYQRRAKREIPVVVLEPQT